MLRTGFTLGYLLLDKYLRRGEYPHTWIAPYLQAVGRDATASLRAASRELPMQATEICAILPSTLSESVTYVSTFPHRYGANMILSDEAVPTVPLLAPQASETGPASTVPALPFAMLCLSCAAPAHSVATCFVPEKRDSPDALLRVHPPLWHNVEASATITRVLVPALTPAALNPLSSSRRRRPSSRFLAALQPALSGRHLGTTRMWCQPLREAAHRYIALDSGEGLSRVAGGAIAHLCRALLCANAGKNRSASLSRPLRWSTSVQDPTASFCVPQQSRSEMCPSRNGAFIKHIYNKYG
ncbi:hypothetical protein C8R47DRAFT_1218617 [Mycena vitilis]|nr:hypothetical protein C8R47DRAFT_1218617 [Mycena vitilis]